MPQSEFFKSPGVSQGTVDLFVVRSLVDYLSSIGVAPASLVDPALLSSLRRPATDARHPLPDVAQCFCRAAETLDDPYLGLHVGDRMRLSALGPSGSNIARASTLGEALILHQETFSALDDHSSLVVSVASGQLEIGFSTASGWWGSVYDAFVVSSLLSVIRELVGLRVPAHGVAFPGVPPPHGPGPYAEFFGCTPRWQQPRLALRWQVSGLSTLVARPVPSEPPVSPPSPHAAAGGGEGLAAAVSQAILHAARFQEPSLERVAALLGVTRRELTRDLGASGLRFRELRDEILLSLAAEALRGTTRPLEEIALSLGYSEQSAFNRAFRKWTGVTPGAFRRGKGPMFAPANDRIFRRSDST